MVPPLRSMSILALTMPPGGRPHFPKQGRTRLYIAMNRFRIGAGFEDGFEEMWRTRDSKLDSVPGFRKFKMLKGPELEGGGTLFIPIRNGIHTMPSSPGPNRMPSRPRTENPGRPKGPTSVTPSSKVLK